ncbi:MAG: tRNA3(Ser)-specific nuclease WapA [Candidatus Anoxychlamydiales bacterium]|nr:tRNA3(Ser)-specific nuclease WapA [Candidatus Anoxychlamydiales bacterium]
MFRKTLIFFIFLSLNLFSNELEDFNVTVSTNSTQMAEGIVNVITGHLHFYNNDIIANAKHPITYGKSYLSMDNNKAALVLPEILQEHQGGWSSLKYLRAYIKYDNKEEERGRKLLFYDPNGSILECNLKSFEKNKKESNKNFQKRKESEIERLDIDNNILKTLIKTSSITSSKNNYKNYNITKFGDREIKIISPDGTKRIYTREKGADNTYYLDKEIYLNGAVFKYEYKKNKLNKIISLTKDEKKEYTHLDIDTDITTYETIKSNIHELKYHFFENKTKNPIKKIEIKNFKNNEKIKESYKYIDKNNLQPLLEKIIFPNNRIYGVNFYLEGKKNYENDYKFIKQDDFKLFKVSSLKSPIIQNDTTLHDTHIFFYEKNITTVTEKLNSIDTCKTKYFYNDNKRISQIQKFDKNSSEVKYQKCLFYEENDENKKGFLNKEVYLDKNVPIKAIEYDYDNLGNVKKETIYGNITGNFKFNLTVDLKNGKIIQNGVDKSIKLYEYNESNLVNKITENNTITTFEYETDTNLVKQKNIYEILEDKSFIIRQRTYNFYDENKILIKQIIEDVSNNRKQHIKEYKIRDKFPLGLVDTFEESFINLDKNIKLLIKKEHYDYSNDCKITKKDIYGSDNKLKHTLYYEYDERGNLISETDPLNRKAIYKYDANNNKVKEIDFSKKEIFYEYDYCNRLISKKIGITPSYIEKYDYDFKHNKTIDTDIYGNTKKYEYDAFGNIIKEVLPPIEISDNVFENPTLTYKYDAFNNLIEKKDANGNITKTIYSIFNKPLTIKYPNGSIEKNIYNVDGTLNSHINSNGTSTLYEYDYLKRIISKKNYSKDKNAFLSEEYFEYDLFNLIKKIDPDNNYIVYTYDVPNRKISEEFFDKNNNLLSSKKIEYDPLNNISKVTESVFSNPSDINEKLITIYERDLLGRVLKEKVLNSSNNILRKINFKYEENALGSKKITIKNINSKESIDIKEYDILNRLVKYIDALGNKTNIRYDLIKKREFNLLRKEVINPLNQKTITIFDPLNKEKIIEIKNPLDQRISLEEKYYDLNANLTDQNSSIYNQTILDRNIYTHFDYNNMNKLISIIENYNNSDSKTTRYEYNQSNLKIKTIKPDLNELIYEYDELQNNTRLYSKIVNDRCFYKKNNENITKDIDYTFKYDNLNRAYEIIDNVNNTTIFKEYDAFSSVIKEKLSNDLIVENEYDSIGNLTKSIYYNDFDFKKIEVRYFYDPLNLKKIIRYIDNVPYYTHEFLQYDLSGNLLEEELINNAGNVYYNLDLLGNIRSIQTPYHTQNIKYDVISKITNIDWTGLENSTNTYDYDDLNQLLLEKGDFDNNYKFDSNNNRLIKNQDEYIVNNLNEIVKTNDYLFIYDLNGNPIIKKESDKEIKYFYDSLDRLIRIEKDNEFISDYKYDAFHRRISKQVTYNSFLNKNYLRYFLYNDQNEIGSLDESYTLKEFRVLSDFDNAEISSSISFELNGSVYAPIHDISGNVTTLIYNSSLYEHYRYSAFGERKVITSWGSYLSTNNPWQFSSKRKDEESNLIYFGRRYYDPELGRWLTCDPLGFVDGMNLYAYVFNDPLNNEDLYGLYANYIASPTLNMNFENNTVANISAGILHESAMFAVNGAMLISDVGFVLSSPFLWSYHGLGGNGSFSNDYLLHLSETRNISFAAENFIQRVIPAQQNSNAYQISKMITGSTYDGIAIGSVAYGGYSLFKSSVSGIKNIGQLKSFKIQNSNQMDVSKALSNRAYCGIDIEKTIKNIKKDLNIKLNSKVPKEGVISWLQKNGLKIKGKSPNGKFIEFMDKNERIRAKIHPPDKVTKYNHLHLYDKKGNALNAEFKKTNRKSFESHIEIGE